jgi:hypothetical protein
VPFAQHVPDIVHLRHAAQVKIFESDVQGQRHVGSARLLALTSATETEHGENVERVLLTSTVGLVLLQPLLPMLIVNFPLFRVADNIMCVGDLLHALLCLLVSRVLVRMELQAELAIRALDLLLTGAFSEAQNSVIVSVRQDELQRQQSEYAAEKKD